MSGERKKSIERLLARVFTPCRLEVINESHKHAGHQHFDGTGETHFRVKITARQFSHMSRVERHRAINEVLQDEFDRGLHALAIEAEAPEQTAGQMGKEQ